MNKIDRNKNSTFITSGIQKFDKNKYENVMCCIACGVFLVPVLKLFTAIAFNYWNEVLWVQLMQFAGVAAVLSLFLYLAHLGVEGTLKDKTWEYLKRNKWIFLMLFFVLCMFLSFFINKCYEGYVSFANAMYGTTLRNEGILLRMLEVMTLIAMSLVTDDKKKKKVIAFILGTSVILTIPVIAQANSTFEKIVGLNNNSAYLYMTQAGLYNSIFAHVNHYGYYLSMILLLSAGVFVFTKNWKIRIASLTVFGLNTAVLVINNTFGAWLAVFAALILITPLFVINTEKKKEKILKMAGIFLFYLILSTVVSSDGDSVWKQMLGLGSDVESVASSKEEAADAGSGRWGVWVIAGKYIVKHPLFGGCEDCMVSVYQEAEYKILTRPANEYLQYGAFFGIPALLCYVMTLIMIAVQKIKNVKRLSPAILILGGAVLSYAISACFGNTTVYTTFDFFVLLGLVTCDKTQE